MKNEFSRFSYIINFFFTNSYLEFLRQIFYLTIDKQIALGIKSLFFFELKQSGLIFVIIE